MTATPKIYYLDDIPTPYRIGVQRKIAELCRGKFHVAYCAEAEPGRQWTFDFSGLEVEILDGHQFRPKNQINPMSVKWNPSVLKSLSAYNPDVVVISGYVHPTAQMAAWWCRRHNVPYGIASETHARSTGIGGLRWIFKRLVTRQLLRNMNFMLPTGKAAGEFLNLLTGIEKPSFLFPNTPDVSAFANAAMSMRNAKYEQELRRHFNIPGSHKIMLFVGRLIGAKRPFDALRAFQDIGSAADKATLLFVGDGPLAAELRAEARGDDRVIFAGWIEDRGQTASLMSISSALVLPSEHEPWGAVVNESMAAGTPVIASNNVGAALELIEDGRSGFIFKVGDIHALSTAMSAILSSTVLHKEMGQTAQAVALAHGHEFAATNFLRAVEYAIGETVR